MSNGAGAAPIAAFNHRLLPPANGGKITLKGRVYDPAGGVQDVPEFDSSHLQANGWVFLATSGPTAGRPTSALGTHPLFVGTKYWDTTLSKTIMWDGKVWRDEAGTSH